MRRSHKLYSAVTFGSSVLCGAALSSASLVHRYSFNDGTANDSFGTANGTVTGAAVIANGVVTTTGGSGDYINLPASVGTGITGDFTIEDFVTVPTNPGNYSSLYSFSSTGNRNFLLLNPSRPNNGGGNLAADFQQSSGADIEKDLIAGSPFNFGATEQDIALTYVSATNIATVYVNGVSVVSGDITSAVNTGTSLNFQALTSGGSDGINGHGPFGDNSINGSTDDLRIYDSALSSAQIAANSAAGPNSVPEPATLGLIGIAGIAAAQRRRRISDNV